jgi:nicotinamide-nucleotide amidase
MGDRLTGGRPRRLGELLLASGKTLAVAESCTGGLLAGSITAVAGCSRYFLGGVVAYHNAAKERALGVPPSLVAAHGAVSGEVALAMAEGALSRFGADIAIATTGVAGPGGGTREKPVGTVWVAVADRRGVRRAHRLRFGGDRGEVRRATVRAALSAAVSLLSEGREEGP